MADAQQPGTAPRDHPKRPAAPRRIPPFTQTVGRIALGVTAALFVAFSLDNLHPVPFEWIFGGSGGGFRGDGVPLIVLLLGSFGLGTLVGAGMVWRRHRVRRVRWERAQAGQRPPGPRDEQASAPDRLS